MGLPSERQDVSRPGAAFGAHRAIAVMKRASARLGPRCLRAVVRDKPRGNGVWSFARCERGLFGVKDHIHIIRGRREA